MKQTDKKIINVRDLAGGKYFADFFSIVLPADLDLEPGMQYILAHKSTAIGLVEVVDVRTFKVDQVRSFIAASETGDTNVKKFHKKMQLFAGPLEPKDELANVVLKYVKRDFKIQQQLLAVWWSELVTQE